MSTDDATGPAGGWRLRVGFAVAAAAGITAGWSFSDSSAHTFDYVYALVLPMCIAAMCANALLSRTKHSSWLVPLQLVALMLTVTCRPHVPALSLVSLVAGVMAIIAALRGHEYAAVAGAVLCSIGVSASLVIPLLARG